MVYKWRTTETDVEKISTKRTDRDWLHLDPDPKLSQLPRCAADRQHWTTLATAVMCHWDTKKIIHVHYTCRCATNFHHFKHSFFQLQDTCLCMYMYQRKFMASSQAILVHDCFKTLICINEDTVFLIVISCLSQLLVTITTVLCSSTFVLDSPVSLKDALFPNFLAKYGFKWGSLREL